MSPTAPNEDRRLELLAAEVLGELDTDEQAEFDTMMSELDHLEDAGFERAASALMVGLVEPEPMPQSLRDTLLRSIPAASVPRPQPAAKPVAEQDNDAPAVIASLSWVPWLAAAACLLLAIGVLLSRSSPTVPTLDPTAAERYAVLLEEAPADLVRWNWQGGVKDWEVAEGFAGEVVWSDARQEGYMVFEGLPANDPRSEQYQLWIFDASRDEAYPVDGGVFDVNEAGRVVVRIDPKIHVNQAAAFAVTVEEPGGVVVSLRERIATLAAPG